MASVNPKAGESPSGDLGSLPTPPVAVESFPEYLLGFPMLVAIDVRNTTAGSTYSLLPETDLLQSTVPVAFTFVSSAGVRVELPRASSAGKEPAEGFTLKPGESRRMLFDLSGLEPELTPGAWRLEAVYYGRKGSSTAPPVDVKITAPSAGDAAIAAALRRGNDFGESSWVYFLTANWRTVDATKLSPRAKEALAFHLFLHRAIYGPLPVARLEADGLKAFAKGPLEGEAAVLRHERMTAAKQDAAAVEAEILKRWPGLKERVEENRQLEGFLTRMRRANGAEQVFEKPPKTWPYRD